MAGFLAGVRTREHEKDIHDENEEHSDEDDEQYIMRKGNVWLKSRGRLLKSRLA